LVTCGPPRPNTYQCNDSLYNDPRSIDDFWHAAVNGRGRFFSASDPTTVIEGLGDALAQIDDKVASGTAEGVSTLQPTETNNSAYSTSYTSGVWEGDVQARKIDVSDGTLQDPVWSAKDKIGPRQGFACDDRRIYLIHGGNSLSNFTSSTYRCNSGSPVLMPDGLDSAELDKLLGVSNANLVALTQWSLMTSSQQTATKETGRLVNFIRGQRAHEGFQIGADDKVFRKRGKGVLYEGYIGDIVNSQPVYVGEPFANYQENNYGGFKLSLHDREPMIYVGANDGMLHAFYATTDTSKAYRGQEAWAVIPSAVLGNLWKLADDGYKRDGHQFYVDGTPVAGDVWNGTEWRTILVGGLNAGGRGYYALDVTVPGDLPTPLWEFKLDLGQCPGTGAGADADRHHRRLQPRPDLRQADHHQARHRVGRDGHLGLQQQQRRDRRRLRLSLRHQRRDRQAEVQDLDGERERPPIPAAWRRSTTTSTTSMSTTRPCVPTAATCSATSTASSSRRWPRIRPPRSSASPRMGSAIRSRSRSGPSSPSSTASRS
jgi:Tfp pilus tip-associated adhesin PilY1